MQIMTVETGVFNSPIPNLKSYFIIILLAKVSIALCYLPVSAKTAPTRAKNAKMQRCLEIPIMLGLKLTI